MTTTSKPTYHPTTEPPAIYVEELPKLPTYVEDVPNVPIMEQYVPPPIKMEQPPPIYREEIQDTPPVLSYYDGYEPPFYDEEVVPHLTPYETPHQDTPLYNEYVPPPPQDSPPIVPEGAYTLPGNDIPEVKVVAPETCPPPLNPLLTHECAGAISNCWSPGYHDTDCPNHGLCCFNGCANICLNDSYGKIFQNFFSLILVKTTTKCLITFQSCPPKN